MTRRGYTLVELLVTVGIILLLAALVVPAVQRVRETAARAKCLNNLHQVGLASQAHHHTRHALPRGGTPAPSGWYGYSWWCPLLPHLEQGPVHRRLDLDGSRAPADALWPGVVGVVYVPGGNTHNAGVVVGASYPLFRCPSTTLPATGYPGATPPVPLGVDSPTYVGIAGSVRHPTARDRSAEPDPHLGRGVVSAGGALVNYQRVTLADITDGASNTLLVGEQGDWCRDAGGVAVDCRSDFGHGWLMGPAAADRRENRHWNLTVVRYGVNDRRWENPGVGDDYYGQNRPFASRHPGGVNVLLCDGSARFLREAVGLDTLYSLSDRDDRVSVGDW